MAAGYKALVKPEMLRWARSTSGVDMQAAASKAQVPPERLLDWEAGHAQPSMAQLRGLATAYKRPLAAFYLPEPPADIKPLQDFRRLGGSPLELSAEARLAHRQAVHRREVALELAEACGFRIPPFEIASWSVHDCEVAASRLREALGIELDEQMRWSNADEALTAWRSASEAAGVLVCQAQGIPADEISGFSVPDFPLPVVVLNSRDHPHRRIFTLLHELAHLAGHEGGLCNTQWEPQAARVEEACNHIAGAALVPLDHLHNETMVRGHGASEEWSDRELSSLARRYSVSREVMLRRLLAAGLTTREFVQAKRAEFVAEYARWRKKQQDSEGGPPPERLAVSRAGRLFTRLVLQAYGTDVITMRDACLHLGVKAGRLERVTEAAFAGEA